MDRYLSVGVAALLLLLASCSVGIQSFESGSPSSPAVSASLSLCPGPAVTIEDVAGLRPDQRLACFGAKSLTMVGFYPQVFGSGTCDGSLLPGDGWLQACEVDALVLASDRGSAIGITARLSPVSGLTENDVQPDQWLRVTGHFDDPAAQRCRAMTMAGEVVKDPQVVHHCREVFAVTELQAVPEPR